MPWILFSLRTHFLNSNSCLIFLRPLPRKVTIHQDCSSDAPSPLLSLWVGHKQHCYLEILPYLLSDYYVNQSIGSFPIVSSWPKARAFLFVFCIIVVLLILHVKVSLFKLKLTLSFKDLSISVVLWLLVPCYVWLCLSWSLCHLPPTPHPHTRFFFFFFIFYFFNNIAVLDSTFLALFF